MELYNEPSISDADVITISKNLNSTELSALIKASNWELILLLHKNGLFNQDSIYFEIDREYRYYRYRKSKIYEILQQRAFEELDFKRIKTLAELGITNPNCWRNLKILNNALRNNKPDLSFDILSNLTVINPDQESLKNSIFSRNPELVRMILQRGVKPQTLMHISNPEILELLIQYGADVNEIVTEKTGSTILMQAIRRMDFHAVRVLVMHEADLDNLRWWRSKARQDLGPGKSALDVAKQYRSKALGRTPSSEDTYSFMVFWNTLSKREWPTMVIRTLAEIWLGSDFEGFALPREKRDPDRDMVLRKRRRQL